MFCLADLCKPLSIANPRNVRARLDEEDVREMDTPTTSGMQQMIYVTEPGLYTTILRSNSPSAKQFRKWVTSEVLPTIRKTGGYIPTQEADTPEVIMAKALQIAQSTIENQKQRVQMLEGEKSLLERENRQLAPKAEYTDKVLQSANTYTMTQVAKEFGMSAHTFGQRLRSKGVMFYQSGQWLLTYKYQDKGYTKPRTHQYTHSDGTTGTNTITVWTELGRAFLHKLFE